MGVLRNLVISYRVTRTTKKRAFSFWVFGVSFVLVSFAIRSPWLNGVVPHFATAVLLPLALQSLDILLAGDKRRFPLVWSFLGAIVAWGTEWLLEVG